MQLIRFISLALVVLVLPTAAHAALACSVSMTDEAFGSIDVLTGTSYSTTATVTVSCSGGSASQNVRACISIAAGSGGSDATSRLMSGPAAAALRFDLYSDSGMSTVWNNDVILDFTLNAGGSGNGSRTVYGKILGGQQTAPAGSYSSTFASSPSIKYGPQPSDSSCVLSDTASTSFMATATVLSNCALSASNLNFGAVGVLVSSVNGQSSLSVQCNTSLAYAISLDGGNAGASDPTQRKMSFGGRDITYGLFQDSSRSQPWGSSSGVNTVSGTGTGASQSITVYGRVPAQPTPPPATYSDTIVVTVTY